MNPVRAVVKKVLRAVLKAAGGVVLVVTGKGLPKDGEDRLWKESHPDDDR